MFADMSLDNRTVEKFAAPPAAPCGFLRPLETSPRPERLKISPKLIVL
jgi:hypothetical protein